MDELLTREFTDVVNCFVLPRQLDADFELLFPSVRAALTELHGANRMAANKNFRTKFDPSAIHDPCVQEFSDLICEDLRLCAEQDFILQTQYESVGSDFSGKIEEHQPHHHWGNSQKGCLLFNYGKEPSWTAAPENVSYLTREFYELKKGSQPISLGIGTAARFAVAASHKKYSERFIADDNPFVHWGRPSKHKVLGIGY